MERDKVTVGNETSLLTGDEDDCLSDNVPQHPNENLETMIAALLSLTAFLAGELSSVKSDGDFYTAAVYEHARYDSATDSAQVIIQRNLANYTIATEIAKSKGADCIVFPEYGVFSPGERSQLKRFLEDIPDPKASRVNPCEESETYSDRPILYALSCLAKNNSIFVVANTGDIKKCEGEPDCPSDGDFHFNTNVVFDRTGTLLVRYHKEHLFYEFGMDLARETQQDTTFETDFGTFATYICFDIDYADMSRVARQPDVDGIMFPTMWVEQPPQMKSIQIWEAWAIANNSTILASNIQLPGYNALGSGIFHGSGPLTYTFNPDGISKLLVAKVPKSGSEPVSPDASITAITETRTWDWKDDGKDVGYECSSRVLGQATDIRTEYRCVEENVTDYSYTELEGPSGHFEICNNGLCCSLDYTTTGLFNRFFLGAFNGLYNHFGRYSWYEEDCILVRCDARGDRPCATFPMKSETVFTQVLLKGNFSSEIVFPSVLENDMRLTPKSDWRFERPNEQEAFIQFNSETGRKVITVGMKGRSYDKDPPYQR
ncbi:pantetheinase [Nephila pilipes]|uniref:Pantetheinase n=1 Tax=Nephila pilipes TaxID=299642 RepID=A0A8X6N495_NEPPI|nr:pantetheinase [Nephila pilipes]